MRGSAAFRTAVAPGSALAGPWVKNELWRRARAVPSLDLQFADNKSLIDAVTGQSLVTLTRASSGTFVGSDGLIKTATTNLLLRSEEFDNATWSKTSSSVTANAIAAPNGTLTADQHTHTSGGGPRLSVLGAATIPASSIFICSFYAKAGTATFAAISIYDGSTNGNRFWFNLSNGTVGSITNIGTGYGTRSSSIVAQGDGWCRCVVTITNGSNTTVNIDGLSACLDTNGSLTPAVSGVFGYLWGAQLEQSSTVGEYIPTTSVINSAPRFDHNPTTGESLGLLVEEQRVNLLLRSEEFDSAAWTKTRCSITANAITAPDGTATADKLVENTSTNTHHVSQGSSFVTGTAYTYTVYAKAAERSSVTLVTGGSATATAGVRYNLTTGVASAATGTPASFSITQLPDGWYRCSLTQIATSTASDVWQIRTDTGSSSSYTGDGTSGIYIWGAQLEAGAFPTSYIPTTTSAVTRSADVASITGSNFSSWYRQDEGTLFADIVGFPIASGQFPRIVELSDGTSNNIIRLQQYSSNLVRNGIITGNVGQMAQDGGTIAQGVRGRVALAVATDNCAFVVNGGTPSADSSVTVPVVITQATIAGTTSGIQVSNSTIRRLTYWPTRLPNSTLQEVTR